MLRQGSQLPAGVSLLPAHPCAHANRPPQIAHMYGIACAALGMLATIATCLAIDAYGPISDNAGEPPQRAGEPTAPSS